jgi:uncharacterized protein YpuA (DUF1002 family)
MKKKIDLGIEREYPEIAMAEMEIEEPTKVEYPQFSVADKPELLNLPDEFTAEVELKVISREERESYDDEEETKTYVGFKILSLKPIKGAGERSMASTSDYEVDFSEIEDEEEED